MEERESSLFDNLFPNNTRYEHKMNHVHAVLNRVKKSRDDINTRLLDGSTAVYSAAEGGHASQVKTLAELGADVNSPNKHGWTPVIVATCNDQVEVIKILADFGANLNSRDNNGDAAVTIAAWNNCVASLHVLAELGADMDLPDEDGSTPLFTAHVADQHEGCVALMTLGVDVSQYMSWSLHSGVAPARKFFYDFFDNCEAPLMSNMCPLFSLSKLMSRMTTQSETETKTVTDETAGDSVNLVSHRDDGHHHIEDTKKSGSNKNSFETLIANGLYHSVTLEKLQQLQNISYPIKYKLFKLAYRVYTDSLTLDGSRITPTTKALRYVELVTLLCDKAMLAETFSLRVTCKANNYIRRFPVYCGREYRELEANLIESFIALGASRFVATADIKLAIRMHG